MHLPEAKNFTPAPAGAHIAVCIAFYDLGTQDEEYQGEAKRMHKVYLAWELVNEQMEDGRPFIVGREYTWSMSDRSKLRAHLESWRGRAFDEKVDFGPNGFHTKKLIGKPCTLTITHTEKGRAKVEGVAPPMKGVAVPPHVTPELYFAMDAETLDKTAFDAVPEWLRKKIAVSPEYQELTGAVPMNGGGYQHHPDLDDEIPF